MANIPYRMRDELYAFFAIPLMSSADRESLRARADSARKEKGRDENWDIVDQYAHEVYLEAESAQRAERNPTILTGRNEWRW